MTYSPVLWTGSKTPGETISVPWGYLSRDHVKVYVDGEPVGSSFFVWTSNSVIEVLTGFPLGDGGGVYRETPRASLPSEQQGVGSFDWQGANDNDTLLLYIQQEIDASEDDRQAVTDDLLGRYDSLEAIVTDQASASQQSAQTAAQAASSAQGHATRAEAAESRINEGAFLLYVDDDDIGVRVIVSEVTLIGETTTPYPGVTLEIAA